MRSGELAQKRIFLGVEISGRFLCRLDSIEKFVVYGMNHPFGHAFSWRQPKPAIGMQLKDSIEKVDLLVVGFDDKTLCHEARAIATFVDRPIEIAPSVVVLDAELVNGDVAEGLSTSAPRDSS